MFIKSIPATYVSLYLFCANQGSGLKLGGIPVYQYTVILKQYRVSGMPFHMASVYHKLAVYRIFPVYRILPVYYSTHDGKQQRCAIEQRGSTTKVEDDITHSKTFWFRS